MADQVFHEVTFSEFTRVAPYIIDAGYPIMLRGKHGIGKSELVYWLAENHCKLPVVERRASQMDVGDLVGLPILKDGDVTSFAPPDWLAQACSEPVVLFLDEADRAVLEVAQGIFELCDSRKICGNTLHPGTKIFAAVNGGASGAQYQVREMDPAELDRWSVFDVRPSVDDWLEWATNYGKVENIVIEFLSGNREHLENLQEHDASVVYPSRRSWVRFDRVLKTINERGEDYYQFKGLENIGSSIVGLTAAVAFGEFVRTYDTAVTFEDILQGNKKKKWDKLDFESYNMIGRHLKHQAPENLDYWRTHEVEQPEVSSKEMNNVREFLLNCPDEILINVTRLAHPLVSSTLTSPPRTLENKKRKNANDKRALKLMKDLKAKMREASVYMANKADEEKAEKS